MDLDADLESQCEAITQTPERSPFVICAYLHKSDVLLRKKNKKNTTLSLPYLKFYLYFYDSCDRE